MSYDYTLYDGTERVAGCNCLIDALILARGYNDAIIKQNGRVAYNVNKEGVDLSAHGVDLDTIAAEIENRIRARSMAEYDQYHGAGAAAKVMERRENVLNQARNLAVGSEEHNVLDGIYATATVPPTGYSPSEYLAISVKLHARAAAIHAHYESQGRDFTVFFDIANSGQAYGDDSKVVISRHVFDLVKDIIKARAELDELAEKGVHL